MVLMKGAGLVGLREVDIFLPPSRGRYCQNSGPRQQETTSCLCMPFKIERVSVVMDEFVDDAEGDGQSWMEGRGGFNRKGVRRAENARRVQGFPKLV
jgi:hypothetical protein